MAKLVRTSVTGPANQTQLRFNENAVSDKVSETGFDYTGGYLGAVNAAKRCGQFKPVLVCNSGAAVHYVAFGATSAMAAPTGLTDGVMIPPHACVTLSSGENLWVRADNAAVGAYVAVENVIAGS